MDNRKQGRKSLKPFFINPNGYRDDVVDVTYSWWSLKLHPTVIHRITMHKYNPLTWKGNDHLYYRTNKCYESDLGSTPWVVQWFFPKDQFRDSYVFHDSWFMEGGIWISGEYDGPYYFRQTSMSMANEFLGEMVQAQGATPVQKNAIWTGVKVGGYYAWNKGDRRKIRLRELGKEIIRP